MKYQSLLKKAICTVAVAGMLLQMPQAAYADVTSEAADATMDQQTEDSTQTGQTEDTPEETPDDNTEDTQEVQPESVEDVVTTKTGKTTVLLEWDSSEGAKEYLVYRKEKGKSYTLLKTTKRTQYTDKKVASGKTYTYRVSAKSGKLKAEEAAEVTFSNTKAVQIKSQKYTYNQMKTDLRELESKYSNYCELTKIGSSVEGRDIYDFAIGAPDAENSLLVISTLHAREYICVAVMMKELEYYLENYNQKIGGVTPAKLLENMQIHYVVMANPDGVTLSQTKYARWKANGRGVDLNRNFPAKNFRVGGKAGAEGYSGKKALSEPESQAVAELTQSLKETQNLCGVVNYHAMGRIIYGACSDSKIKKDTETMYQIAKKNTGYAKAYEGGGGSSSGGQYREYVMDLLRLPSITIEVGTSAAPCPYSQYETEFQKNKYVVIQIADALQK